MLIEAGQDNVEFITYLSELEESLMSNSALIKSSLLENILVYNGMNINGIICSHSQHSLMGEKIFYVELGNMAIVCDTADNTKRLLTKISAIMYSPNGEDALKELLQNAQELFFQTPKAWHYNLIML